MLKKTKRYRNLYFKFTLPLTNKKLLELIKRLC